MSHEPSSQYWKTARTVASPLRRSILSHETDDNAARSHSATLQPDAVIGRLIDFLPVLFAGHVIGFGYLGWTAFVSQVHATALGLAVSTLLLDVVLFSLLRLGRSRGVSPDLCLIGSCVYAFATGGLFSTAISLGVGFVSSAGMVATVIILANGFLAVLALSRSRSATIAFAAGTICPLIAQTPDVVSTAIACLFLGGLWMATKPRLTADQAPLDGAEPTRSGDANLLQLAEVYGDSETAVLWETDRNDTLVFLSHGLNSRVSDSLPDGKRTLGSLFALPGVEDGPQQSADVLIAARTQFKNASTVLATGGDDSWWALSGRPIIDEFGRFNGFRGYGCELTGDLRSDAASAHRSRYDTLTGLAGRALIKTELEQAIGNRKAGQTGCALFLLDLDRFKLVNDTLGHPAGDELLKLVAERLTAQVGKLARIGRLGGDEFIVVIPGETSRANLADLARSVIHTLSKTYIVQDTTVSIGASVGIAIAPYDGDNASDIVARADMALYAAKSDGRGVHRFYDDKLHDVETQRRSVRNELRDAIHNGGIKLVYQPFVDATTGKIVGFEAFARWHHPERGIILPGEFLPIAETAGLDRQLGEVILLQACREATNWPANIRLAVNVSAAVVESGALVKMLEDALDISGLTPSRLEVDMSEEVFCALQDKAERVARDIRKMGARIAMDDFGAGDTALSTLKCTAIDKIKFDPGFIAGAGDTQKRDAAILRSIIHLSESLGIETLAEGVEAEDDAALARLLGCKCLQGYLFGQPVGADAIPSLIAEDRKKRRGEKKDARKVTRTTLFRAAMIYCDELDYKVVVRNISPIGASIECPKIFAVDTILALDIGVGDPVSARVAWSDSSRMGLRFVSPFDMNLIRGSNRP